MGPTRLIYPQLTHVRHGSASRVGPIEVDCNLEEGLCNRPSPKQSNVPIWKFGTSRLLYKQGSSHKTVLVDPKVHRSTGQTDSSRQDGCVAAHHYTHSSLTDIHAVRYAAAALATNPEKSAFRWCGYVSIVSPTSAIFQPPVLGANISAPTSRTCGRLLRHSLVRLLGITPISASHGTHHRHEVDQGIRLPRQRA